MEERQAARGALFSQDLSASYQGTTNLRCARGCEMIK